MSRASSLFHPSIYKTFIQQHQQEIIISPPSLLLCAFAEWWRRDFKQKYSSAKAINSKYLCNFLSYRLNILKKKGEHFISAGITWAVDLWREQRSSVMRYHTHKSMSTPAHCTTEKCACAHAYIDTPPSTVTPKPLSIHTHTHTRTHNSLPITTEENRLYAEVLHSPRTIILRWSHQLLGCHRASQTVVWL